MEPLRFDRKAFHKGVDDLLKLRVLRKAVAALLAACFLAACTTTPKGSFCAISDPIRLSDATIAQLTDAEVERLLAHNLKGKKLCGWRA